MYSSGRTKTRPAGTAGPRSSDLGQKSVHESVLETDCVSASILTPRGGQRVSLLCHSEGFKSLIEQGRGW